MPIKNSVRNVLAVGPSPYTQFNSESKEANMAVVNTNVEPGGAGRIGENARELIPR